MSVNIIHEKCEKKAAEDKTLPRNAYLVTYVEKDKMTYDIVLSLIHISEPTRPY